MDARRLLLTGTGDPSDANVRGRRRVVRASLACGQSAGTVEPECCLGAAVASTTVTLVKRGSTRGARLYSRLAAAAAALPSCCPLSPAVAAGTGRGRVRGRFLGPTTGVVRV